MGNTFNFDTGGAYGGGSYNSVGRCKVIRKARWSWLDHIGFWVILAALIWCGAWLATDVTRSLNVSALEIENVEVGDPIFMSVARSLSGKWAGGYNVTIRRTDGGSLVCTTGPVFVPYSDKNKDGTDRLLPEPLTLKWWAWGGSCTAELEENTLPAGRYAVETCHAKRFLRFWYKWHCWQGGPVFSVNG